MKLPWETFYKKYVLKVLFQKEAPTQAFSVNIAIEHLTTGILHKTGNGWFYNETLITEQIHGHLEKYVADSNKQD